MTAPFTCDGVSGHSRTVDGTAPFPGSLPSGHHPAGDKRNVTALGTPPGHGVEADAGG